MPSAVNALCFVVGLMHQHIHTNRSKGNTLHNKNEKKKMSKPVNVFMVDAYCSSNDTKEKRDEMQNTTQLL